MPVDVLFSAVLSDYSIMLFVHPGARRSKYYGADKYHAAIVRWQLLYGTRVACWQLEIRSAS
jgi:hypothetical protein